MFALKTTASPGISTAVFAQVIKLVPAVVPVTKKDAVVNMLVPVVVVSTVNTC